MLLLVAWCVLCFIAFRNNSTGKNRVVVERQAWYEVQVDGHPVLYYTLADSDSVFKDLSEKRDTAITRTVASAQWTNSHWWFPSCKGTITASIDSLDQPTFSPREVLTLNLRNAEQRIKDLDTMTDEMDYYFSVHDVQDEGFELVVEYYEKVMREMTHLSGVIGALNHCLESDSLTIRHKAVFRAIYNNKVGKQQIDTCVLKSQEPFKAFQPQKGGLKTTLQLLNEKTPRGVKVGSYYSDASLKTLSFAVQRRYEACEDTLDGFGLKVTPEKGVQIGLWANGKYKGEQLEHNSQRIYGIDLSRFQHEKGKKRYNIQWNKLRITSLGTLSKKKVSGKVDYPVSFIYIKATEGTTVKNNYYAADYVQSRKHGYKTGNYHFFSTKTPGAQQAKWYLKNSRHQAGDLPPVLDIEPSAAQINAMGGAEKLFVEVRAWLNAVKAATGVKPILYISQSFVNKYLPLAPDLKQNYQVWIARYGEYKPDVHMLYWQLSPDGRVEGIGPEVDINVFNGYQNKYDEFVSKLK